MVYQFGEAPIIFSHGTRVAERAKTTSVRRLQAELEAAVHAYLAIELASGEHSLILRVERLRPRARLISTEYPS